MGATNIIGSGSLWSGEGVLAEGHIANIATHNEWASCKVSGVLGHGIVVAFPFANLAPTKGAVDFISIGSIEEAGLGEFLDIYIVFRPGRVRLEGSESIGFHAHKSVRVLNLSRSHLAIHDWG